MLAPYAVFAFKFKMLQLQAQIRLSLTSYTLRLNIKFQHTTTIIASASSTYYNKVCIFVPNCGQNLNLEFLFVDTISTHTLYLASLFCLLWVIIVSLNSSHQLLTQERFETVVPSVSIKNKSN